jgi:ribosomal protein S4
MIKKKYKAYLSLRKQNKRITPTFRIRKFKRSKWKGIKKSFNRREFKRCKIHLKFQNKPFVLSPSWRRMENLYRQGLMTKRLVDLFFDGSVRISELKKLYRSKKSLFYKFFFKYLYRLEILLFKLKFFSSVKHAKHFIKRGFILVNGAKVNQTCYLKRGDVVTINTKQNSIKSSFYSISFFYSFCEVDFYSNTVVILKGFKELERRDFLLIFPEVVNNKKFLYYLRKN